MMFCPKMCQRKNEALQTPLASHKAGTRVVISAEPNNLLLSSIPVTGRDPKQQLSWSLFPAAAWSEPALKGSNSLWNDGWYHGDALLCALQLIRTPPQGSGCLPDPGISPGNSILKFCGSFCFHLHFHFPPSQEGAGAGHTAH